MDKYKVREGMRVIVRNVDLSEERDAYMNQTAIVTSEHETRTVYDAEYYDHNDDDDGDDDWEPNTDICFLVEFEDGDVGWFFAQQLEEIIKNKKVITNDIDWLDQVQANFRE